MQKIIIVGCPGAGKSTFARNLHEILGIPLFHLDLIWHKEDMSTVTNEEFDLKLAEILTLPAFIIDGTYTRTLKKRAKKADTIFYFKLPADVCLEGAKSRIGKKREDLPYIEQQLDETFAQSIVNFHRHKRFLIEDVLRPLADKKSVITFTSHTEVDLFLENL